MTFSTAERAAGHRAGRSTPLNSRDVKASLASVFDAQEQNVFSSALPTIAGALTTSGTAYWVYIGRAAKDITVNKVIALLTTNAVGTQAGEVVIASSTSAPNRAAQSLTVLARSTSIQDLTAGAGSPKFNSADLNYVVPSTTHVWAGIRVVMSGTQPQLFGLTADASSGSVLSTAAAGVLAVGTSYSGALIASSVAWQAPSLLVSLV